MESTGVTTIKKEAPPNSIDKILTIYAHFVFWLIVAAQFFAHGVRPQGQQYNQSERHSQAKGNDHPKGPPQKSADGAFLICHQSTDLEVGKNLRSFALAAQP